MQSYDKVDYRSFIFDAEAAEGASEEEVNKAMSDAKSKAEAMLEARQGGADIDIIRGFLACNGIGNIFIIGFVIIPVYKLHYIAPVSFRILYN